MKLNSSANSLMCVFSSGVTVSLCQMCIRDRHANGAVPTTAPEYVVFEGPGMDAFAESHEWGCTFVVLPFMYYEMCIRDSVCMA